MSVRLNRLIMTSLFLLLAMTFVSMFVSSSAMANDNEGTTPTKTTAVKVAKRNAKKKTNKRPITTPKAQSARLSRDIVFDGSNVNGQYHSAGEAVAKVEQEKKMNSLIGIRQDFKDRLSAERDRLKRGEPASVE
jgi:hypothetical protein